MAMLYQFVGLGFQSRCSAQCVSVYVSVDDDSIGPGLL